jgi:ABC-type nitrate/sulfonate/bicarbonate transport system substrate-binding protein
MGSKEVQEYGWWVEERKEMIKLVDIILEEVDSDQKEMVDGIVDMLNQVKDINNRKEMALDRLKDFKKQNIKINTKDFLQKSGLVSIDETWTKEYKKSINCNNPKGFSQRAHCAGRRKRKRGGKTKSKPV